MGPIRKTPCKNDIIMVMVSVSSYTRYHFVLLVLYIASSVSFDGIHGLGNQQEIATAKLVVIKHEFCQSCPWGASSLKDIHTYSELKYDPLASLPSSFTICVSILVTTNNLRPSLFTLLGNDGQPWFSAQIAQFGSFVGKQFSYPVHNQKPKSDTMRMFPNQWVRSCLALDT